MRNAGNFPEVVEQVQYSDGGGGVGAFALMNRLNDMQHLLMHHLLLPLT